MNVPNKTTAAVNHAPRRFALVLKHPALALALVMSLLSALYWSVIASDGYVSEAHVLVQKTDMGVQSVEIGNLLGNIGGNTRPDQLMLRDYLLSVDVLKKIDAKLNLRAHFSNPQRDVLSRMWRENADIETFHEHYLAHIKVEYDDYAGILVIKAQGYDPQTAHAITRTLIEEGERFMNATAHELVEGQVSFLSKQVDLLGASALEARQAVLRYQDSNGLVSPQSTAENFASIVNGLETKLAEMHTRRTALLAYLMPDSPNVVELNQQIAAIEQEITQQNAKLASTSGKTLNRKVEVFQRLQLDAEFKQSLYKTALITLEKARIEAIRSIKKISILQKPTLPQYPLQPRRLYNASVFTLFALLLAGIAQMLGAIIRDHKD